MNANTEKNRAMRGSYKLHGKGQQHKFLLRSYGAKYLDSSLNVLDCFTGIGVLTEYWLSRGAEVTAIEKNKKRFDKLNRSSLAERCTLINDDSLKWVIDNSSLDRFNVYELDATGMPHNWIRSILGKGLTGKKLFAVTDGGKNAMQTRAMIRPSLFDWENIERRVVRNHGLDKLRNYVYYVREWWNRLAEKHGFEVQQWRYYQHKSPVKVIYYVTVVDFG